jgi:hypothetical protein
MDLNTLLNTDPWDWPDDASELLLETLVEKPASEADRLIAADLAGSITAMNDESPMNYERRRRSVLGRSSN